MRYVLLVSIDGRSDIVFTEWEPFARWVNAFMDKPNEGFTVRRCLLGDEWDGRSER